MKGIENITLPRVGELRMGETIIEKDCTGEGLPIYSADKSNRPWAYSTHFKRLNQYGTIVLGARGTIGYPRLPKEAVFGATQTTITLWPDSEKFVPEFVYYALQQLDFSLLGAQQAIPMLTVGNLEAVSIPRYPKPEQSKIAEILSKVDQALEQTERLIAKQQRIKTGLMQNLLTRGIDEHGNLRSEETHEFKDSPLGRIPVVWNKGKGIDLFTLHAGFAVQRLFDSDQGEWLYLKVDDFNNPANSNGLMTASTTFDCSAQLSNRLLAPKTIVFPKRGAAIFLNRVELLKRTATVDPNLMGLRTREGVLPEYMRFILLHRNLSNICDNSGIPQINNKHLYPLIFILPDEFEQRRIVQCLEKCEAAIHIVAGNLHKLRSLKTALMQDLLTGNKRVTPLMENMEVCS